MVDELLTVDSELLGVGDDDDDLFLKKTPQKKYKILMLSDHPLAPSGVGVQARFLIEGLIKTGKFSFRCLGGAMKHQDYSVTTVNPDFIVKPIDGFGDQRMIRDLLAIEQPDAIFIFTGPRQFIWLWEMEDEVRQVCPIVYWHVWDNDPYPAYNSPFYEGTDLINCLAYKTYEMVKPNFPEKTNYIPHAFPKEIYYPLPDDQIAKLRKENFGDRADWFFALWVNRNAARKMPGDVLTSWKMFLDELEKKEGHRKGVLIMHTNPHDDAGPNLLANSELLGLQNNVWFSATQLDFEKMNIMHNITDTTVNISKNEGFGLSTLISMQVGKPIIGLCTGGITRQVIDYRDGTENGVALQPAVRSLIGSQLVPYIHEDFTTHADLRDAFMKIYSMTPEEKAKMKEKVIEYVDHEFNFNNVISEWDRTLTETIEKFQSDRSEGKGIWTLQSIATPVVRVEGHQIVQRPAIDQKKLEENARLQEEVMKKMAEMKNSVKTKKRGKALK